MAEERSQTLAQMAIAWVLRDSRVTAVLIGACTVTQLSDSLGALDNLAFSADQFARIDEIAREDGIDLWRVS